MEITCSRCHQPVQAENCYCSVCGLPQLVYAADGTPGQVQPDHGDGVVRDASCLAWKPALRAALLVAIPAGVLCSTLTQLGSLGFLWMVSAATWAVVLYVRSQKSAWITLGAGARIGLVTGLLGGWLSFGLSSGFLFFQRFVLHESGLIDSNWKNSVEASQQLTAQMGFGDVAQMQAQKIFMLSPEGHAGFETFGFVFNAAFLIFFAVAGGALGARLMARKRQSEL
jgi:hypothetical protein